MINSVIENSENDSQFSVVALDGLRSEKMFDVVVVGAGPAGAVCAAILAARSWRVLLVDRARFPREKTCGGCVNAHAAHMLRELGLESVLLPGVPLTRYDLNVQQYHLHSPIPTGFAVSRSVLDSRLVAAAQSRGCLFLSGVSASLYPSDFGAPFRQLILRAGSDAVIVSARIVLACDGITGTLLDSEPRVSWKTAKNPWLGVSTLLEPAIDSLEYGIIQMNCARGGYVGMSKLSDGRLHLAAALDPRACRAAGSAATLIQKILSECRRPYPPSLQNAKFFGVGRYTRRRTCLGSHRVLAIGDAVGYIEPFTGEGIAWAVHGAREATALLPDPAADWPQSLSELWAQRHHAAIGRRQWLCKTLRALVRRPDLTLAAAAFASAFPAIPDTIAQWIGQPDPTLRLPLRETFS